MLTTSNDALRDDTSLLDCRSRPRRQWASRDEETEGLRTCLGVLIMRASSIESRGDCEDRPFHLTAGIGKFVARRILSILDSLQSYPTAS